MGWLREEIQRAKERVASVPSRARPIYLGAERCVACVAIVTSENWYEGKDGAVRRDLHQVCAEQFGADFMARRS